MLIVLPPSETKADGGSGAPLELESLLWPELRRPRELLIDALTDLAADLPRARAALKVSAAKDAEIARNVLLRRAATMPALDRYTGVLFDSLAAGTMSRSERSRADARIVVASALFGAVRATDAIPAYRLSAGSHLPERGAVTSWWKRAAGVHFAALEGPVLDLRSGAYGAFGHIPGAITVRVVSPRPDGSLAVVSHFNKATKGRLARLVATAPRDITSLAALVRQARRAGLAMEPIGPDTIQIIT